MNPNVFILVLNWNGKDLARTCLNSLAKLNYDRYVVLALDNGSSDGSQEMIRREFPWVKLIENGSNLGYAEGNNRGIKRALDCGADYIFLVNNDSVLHPDVVSHLVHAASENLEYGILGPLAYEFNSWDKPMHSGFHLDWNSKWVWPLKWGEPAEILADSSAVSSFDLVEGDAFFVRRDVFEKIGFLDSRFFLLFEEFDFCIRAKKEGFKVGIARDAKHQRRKSTTLGKYQYRFRYYDTRNFLLFLLKNSGLRNKQQVLMHYLKRFKWDVEDRLSKDITKDFSHFFRFVGSLFPMLHGCFDFLIGRFGRLRLW